MINICPQRHANLGLAAAVYVNTESVMNTPALLHANISEAMSRKRNQSSLQKAVNNSGF